MSQQNKVVLPKWAGILVLAVFLGGIGGIIAFHKTEPLLSILCAGLIFLVVGLISTFSSKMTFNRMPVLLFPLVGAGMVVMPTLFLYEKHHPGSMPIDLEWLSMLLLVLLFLIVGIGVFVAGLWRMATHMRHCTEVVTAQCVDVDMRRSSKSNKMLYSPRWEYQFCGQVYTIQSSGYSSSRVQVGDTKELKIDPQNPHRTNADLGMTVISLFAIGLVCIIVSLIALRNVII